MAKLKVITRTRAAYTPPKTFLDQLLGLRLFLENELGPAPRPTDAQIGMILTYVRDHFDERLAEIRKMDEHIRVYSQFDDPAMDRIRERAEELRDNFINATV